MKKLLLMLTVALGLVAPAATLTASADTPERRTPAHAEYVQAIYAECVDYSYEIPGEPWDFRAQFSIWAPSAPGPFYARAVDNHGYFGTTVAVYPNVMIWPGRPVSTNVDYNGSSYVAIQINHGHGWETVWIGNPKWTTACG